MGTGGYNHLEVVATTFSSPLIRRRSAIAKIGYFHFIESGIVSSRKAIGFQQVSTLTERLNT